MVHVERLSKCAAIASLLAIAALQLALHPALSWPLRAAGVAAFVAGWLGARSAAYHLHAFWLFIAPLAPALLLLVGGDPPVGELLWMAGLSGTLVRMASWSRWTLPPIWSVLLGGWALALSLAWPVVVLREMAWDPATLREMASVNSWAMLSTPDVVAWTLYVVQAQLLALLFLEWLHATFTVTRARLPRALHTLWIGVTVSSVVALVQGTINLSFFNVELWVALERATGMMLDANAYGVAAAVAGPVGLLALRGAEGRPTTAGILVLAVNWGGMWMSGSRTALLCASVAALGLLIGWWRSREGVAVSRREMAVGIGAVAAVVVLVTFAGAVGPLERLSTARFNREGALTLLNRGGYATIATEMIREYPLTGVGAGAYRYLAADYWRAIADDRLALDNAQNWWRHQAAELGLTGSVLVLLWSALVAWMAIRWRVESDPAGPKGPALQPQGPALQVLTLRGLIVGIGASSLLGMPTQNPLVLLLFFFLVAWLSVLSGGAALLPARARWIRAGWAAALVLAVAHAGGQLLLARGPLAVAERAKRFQRAYVEGAYAPEPLPGSREFRWTDDESRFVVPVRGRPVVVQLWANHPDIREQPVTVDVSGPCGSVFQQQLTTPDPIGIGILLPSNLGAVDATIRVSRTWRPADFGSADTRRLGVAVAAATVDAAEARQQPHVVVWRCR